MKVTGKPSITSCNRVSATSLFHFPSQNGVHCTGQGSGGSAQVWRLSHSWGDCQKDFCSFMDLKPMGEKEWERDRRGKYWVGVGEILQHVLWHLQTEAGSRKADVHKSVASHSPGSLIPLHSGTQMQCKCTKLLRGSPLSLTPARESHPNGLWSELNYHTQVFPVRSFHWGHRKLRIVLSSLYHKGR
jgi:hypothetical protein